MIASLILAATAPGNPVEEISRTFGFSLHHFIAQCISFLIVAALLYRFAYRRILLSLEERRQTIAESLANADRIKEELAQTEAQRQQILAQTNNQANQLFEEARAAAAKLQAQENQKAIAAAEQIIAKAHQAAAADYARMLTDLKREVGRLVVQTSAAVTGKVLTPDDHAQLMQETSKRLAA